MEACWHQPGNNRHTVLVHPHEPRFPFGKMNGRHKPSAETEGLPRTATAQPCRRPKWAMGVRAENAPVGTGLPRDHAWGQPSQTGIADRRKQRRVWLHPIDPAPFTLHGRAGGDANVVRHGSPGGDRRNAWSAAPAWAPGKRRLLSLDCALRDRCPARPERTPSLAPPSASSWRRPVTAFSPAERCSGLKNSGCAFR